MNPKIELSSLTIADPVVQTLLKGGFPVTRENYLELAYPEGLPDEWTAELEAELPSELRLDTEE